MKRSASLTAFYDANVLYSAAVRDFLITLTNTGLFRVKWSRDVQNEWIASLLKNRPDLTREKLERTRELMDRHASDALVTGYESLIPDLHLPDPGDRHVVAAAVRGRADVIVTMNLKHFPATIIGPLGLQAQHPDQFVVRLAGLSVSAVVSAAQGHRLSLRKPSKSIEEYLSALEREGLTQTVSLLREHIS